MCEPCGQHLVILDFCLFPRQESGMPHKISVISQWTLKVIYIELNNTNRINARWFKMMTFSLWWWGRIFWCVGVLYWLVGMVLNGLECTIILGEMWESIKLFISHLVSTNSFPTTQPYPPLGCFDYLIDWLWYSIS